MPNIIINSSNTHLWTNEQIYETKLHIKNISGFLKNF